MKFKFLKQKSVFLIYLIITLVFVIHFSEEASAQSSRQVSAGQQACCEVTKTGDSCVYTSKSNCDTSNGNQPSNTNCENTNYCSLGTCIYDRDGECFSNTPKSLCDKNGGTWKTESKEQILQCKSGCCILGGNYNFQSQIECKKLADSIYGASNYKLDDVFKNVNSENECLDLSLQDKEGCCVNNGLCTYQKKSECTSNFNLNKFCSSLNECSNCKAHSYKECKDGNVNWFDSCGNSEDVAESCSYSDGKICAKENNNVFCKSLDCPTTTKYDGWDYTGGARKNDESWCIYDGPTGNFKDRPGSVHYRFSCLNGVEVAESCRDFRQGICLQSNYNNNEFSHAFCTNNNIYNSKIISNISSVAVGFKFWEDKKEFKEQCNKGTTTCTVLYLKKNNFDSWHCKQNCFCESQAFLDQSNTYCKSFGDCGFSYNILEEKGSAGINIFWGGAIKGDTPTTLSGFYLNDLKKYGIFGGMQFLNTETGRVIASLKKAGDFDSSDDVFAGVTAAAGTAAALAGVGAVAAGVAISGGAAVVAAAATVGTAAVGAGTGGALAGAGFTFASAAAVVPVIGWIVAGVVLLLVALAPLAIGGAEVKRKAVTIECNPWQAPLGGKNCEKCTDDKFKECTEYRCKSLGANCELVNEGTDKVKCVNKDPNDIFQPNLGPLDLSKQGYTISKERLGYKVKEDVDFFKLFIFGVVTDEFALCRYNLTKSVKYEDMKFELGDSFFKKEHSLSLLLQPDKEYKYYVKCADANGNINDIDYSINFKTKKGRDTQAPIILDTSIKNNGFVANKVSEAVLDFRINEPGHCKYDTSDKHYDSMNKVSICDDVLSDVPTDYSCTTAFTGLKVGNNNYYIRCNDLKGNNNTQSYPFTLIRSVPLVVTVDDASPKDLIYQNDVSLSVNTKGGSEQGKAVCRYNEKDLNYEAMGEKSEFKVTNSINHLQSQTNLRKGSYEYFIKCGDSAGNEEGTKIKFKIVLDKKGNEIVYTYKDSTTLYVILNVAATCEYDNKDFVYETGKKMDSDTTIHRAPLEFNEYYIKCRTSEGKDIKGVRINV